MILSRLLQEKRSNDGISLRNPSGVLRSIFGCADNSSNEDVNENTALSLSAVWLAIRKISTIMGVFPLPVYRRTVAGKEKASDHPIYTLLHDKPNPYMTAFNWRFLTAAHELTWGAGVSEIEFDSAGTPVALWPLPPWSLRPAESINGELIYELTTDKGEIKKFAPWQLLIFPFYPTLKGGWLSPLRVHSESMGAALAARKFGAKMFGQGVNPAGVVSGIDLSVDESEEAFRERFSSYEGVGSAHRLMFLRDAEKFERVSLPPQDAQYLDSRKFDIAEIARIYDIPTVLLHEHTKDSSWASSVSEMKDGFITLSMMPHCEQWAQEMNTKLLGDSNEFYCKFNIDGLLRGNVKDRAEAYEKFSRLGVFSVNEMRELEDRNLLEEELGNVRLVPMNMAPLDKLVKGERDDAGKVEDGK